jgi:hypothetical protein
MWQEHTSLTNFDISFCASIMVLNIERTIL